MNTQVVLNETQQTNRIAKGFELYNQGYIKRLNNKEFIVNEKYIVSILTDDIFTCTCKDYTYRCNQTTDNNEFMNCKHIHAILFYLVNA